MEEAGLQVGARGVRVVREHKFHHSLHPLVGCARPGHGLVVEDGLHLLPHGDAKEVHGGNDVRPRRECLAVLPDDRGDNLDPRLCQLEVAVRHGVDGEDEGTVLVHDSPNRPDPNVLAVLLRSLNRNLLVVVKVSVVHLSERKAAVSCARPEVHVCLFRALVTDLFSFVSRLMGCFFLAFESLPPGHMSP